MPRGIRGTSVLALALVAGVAAPRCAAAGTERVSVGRHGVQVYKPSGSPSVSADGRYVAFHSDADGLVPGDSNGVSDIFIRDRQQGATRRVSLGPGGAEADGGSYEPVLSPDAHFVAFSSYAGNLVRGDTNNDLDVFVRDLRTGETRRASVSSRGEQADGGSVGASVSADGRVVAFYSIATNLVAGDRNGWDDVFVHDFSTGRTRRVSVTTTGMEGDGISREPALSADGRRVAFWSEVPLVPGDGNTQADVFLRDLTTGELRLVSVGPHGVQGDSGSFGHLAISSTGRIVAFPSYAANLVAGDGNGRQDVFVRDLGAGVTRRVSVRTDGGEGGDGESSDPALSADGKVVAFVSEAPSLVDGDTNGSRDIFVRRDGTTTRGSVGPGQRQANGDSQFPAISADGRVVAFTSGARNLVRGDTNHVEDVFVRTR